MYKRNQLEEAILRSEGHDPAGEVQDIRIRMKRLLDSDRKRAVVVESLFDQAYAFYSAAAPGTGQEVWFTSYEVLALWVGLKLLASGYPQGRVVTVLRHHRKALEREHERITSSDLLPLFGRSGFLDKRATDEHRERLVQEGRLVERIDDMVFLAIEAVPDVGISTRVINDDSDPRPANICRGGKELMHFMEVEGFMKRPVLVVELTNAAHQLTHWLARIEPTRRGRP
ncbi:hypothetical protein FHS82_000751 [Pseudochelatococcus lubricantis]|uniref:Uncharacterized protein n=1 Tax=Pseudochelatococcus lubricantis TaxID=1538102 RepID=A0ABX0UX03_9HYPH|nr:hypothetical protein [Pseudochelatococcus lubricantis]NIJ56938.1 hypothetical protein [Pseudochelatococcus lubricantis]